MRNGKTADVPPFWRSLGDGASGALVHTGSAVDAFVGVDHCHILDGDRILGADIGACTACDTVACNYLKHTTLIFP